MEHATAHVGEPVRIRLASHGGAGYEWRLRDEVVGLRLEMRETLPPEPGAPPGSPRDTVFTFVADQPGEYAQVFSLRRPWEASPVEERTVLISAR